MGNEFVLQQSVPVSYYSVRADLEIRYGETNVIKWADLNNNGDEDEIEARIDWANEQAFTDINGELFGGVYEIPFNPVPAEIVDISARLAAGRLYAGRGVADGNEEGGHNLRPDIKEARMLLRRIRVGKMRLSAGTQVGATHPEILRDENETFPDDDRPLVYY